MTLFELQISLIIRKYTLYGQLKSFTDLIFSVKMNLFAEALSPSEMSYSFEALAADVKKAEEMTEVLRLLSIVNKKISIISDMNEIDECVLPLFEDVLNQKIAVCILIKQNFQLNSIF